MVRGPNAVVMLGVRPAVLLRRHPTPRSLYSLQCSRMASGPRARAFMKRSLPCNTSCPRCAGG